MRWQRRSRTRYTWLACLVILLASLVPGSAQTLSGAKAGWLEICTADGATMVPLDDGTGQKPDPLQAHHLLDHCQCCNPQSSGMAPPPAEAAVPRIVALGRLLPPLFLEGPRDRHVWVSFQPRAPPRA